MKPLEIARRRIHNSRLAETPFTAPEQVVRRHVAMQAQEYAYAKWSIGQRAINLLDEDVDRALAEGSIVRTHVLRPTWHFVGRDDLRWLLALTAPRVHRKNGPRYQALELDERTLLRCERAISAALEGGNHLTRAALAGVLDKTGIDGSGQRLPYILMYCELESVICSGGLIGKQHTYALLDERVPDGALFDRDDAVVELTRRYLASHGPATMKDLRWWSSLTMAEIKGALLMLDDEVESRTVDGMTLWWMASEADVPPARRSAHLLQGYDELIVGYTESRYFGDPHAAAARAASSRGLPTGIVLLNGEVAGHWKRAITRKTLRVELLPYEELKPDQLRRLQAAAADLGGFLQLEVMVDISSLK